MTFKILSYIVMSFFLYSCGNANQVAEIDAEQLDLLIDTNISISKGNQKIVNAVAKELSKDEIHIYLKADYISDESKEIRNKLSFSIIQNPEQSNHIRNVAEDLHMIEGNVKAEFYNNYNDVSSILYSDSAKISNRYNNMIAQGNVIIYSPVTNLMLLGDKILWDNRAKRILSEDNITIVKIIDDDKIPCVQKSKGFESDMDLSNYIFYEIKGKISEDCF